MKLFFFLSLNCFAFTLSAQNSRFAPKMAPIYEEGYYVNAKGDTIAGEIQINPSKKTDFYSQFSFKRPGKSKPRLFTPSRIKAYGFSGRHFILADLEGKKQYVERLSDGRLRLFEYKFEGKVNGYAGVTSDYYIKDTRAEGKNERLKEMQKIRKKFYKKALKPYMEDQPMIWSDLDKYEFDAQEVLSSIKEFNKFYKTTAN